MARERFEIDVVGNDKASTVFGRIRESFAGIAQTAMGFVAGGLITKGIDRLTDSMKALASDAFEAVASQEQLEMTLQSLYAVELSAAAGMDEFGNASLSMSDAMAQAGPKAQELLGWMRELAIASPFDEGTVKQTFQQAVGYGMTADRARDLTDALVNYAAGSGKSNEQTKMLGFALGQVFAKGKLVGEEMRQLTNAGFGVSTMARAMGMDVSELSAKMKDGAISADMVIDGFMRMSNADFPNAAARMSTSLGGLKSTLEDIRQYFLRDMFTPFFNNLKPLLDDLVDTVTSADFAEKVRAWGDAFGRMTVGVLAGAQKVIWVLSAISDAGFGSGEMFEALSAIVGDDMIPTLMGISDTVGAVVGALRDQLGASLQEVGQIVMALLPTVEAGFAAIIAFVVEHGAQIRTVLAEAWGFVQGIIDAVVPAIRDVILFVFGAVQGFLQEHGAQVAATLRGAWETIGALVRSVTDAISAVVTTVFGAIRTFLAQHGAEIQAVLSEAWETMRLAVDVAVTAIQQYVIPAFEAIAKFLREHGTEIQTVISTVWTAIRGVIEAVLKVIQGVLKAALLIMKGDWKGAWDAMKTGVAEAWGVIRQAFEKGKEYLQSINLAEIGRNIINSLADGVRAAKDAVVGAITGVVGGAIDAAKRLLGISSPSRIFAEIGRDMGRGLTDGMLDQRGAVTDAARQMVRAAVIEVGRLAELAAPSFGARGRQVAFAPALANAKQPVWTPVGAQPHYTLNVTSTAPTQRIIDDFALLRAMGGR